MKSIAVQEVVRGARTAVPIVIAMAPIGMILGVTAAQVGFTPLDAGFLAGVNFAGGSEFAALSLWGSTPPLLAIVITTWLINSRHIMLGAALTPYLEKVKTPTALAALYLMCDEIWALAMADIYERRKAGLPKEELLSVPFYFGEAVSIWSTWWISAIAGCAVSGFAGDLSGWGIKMAFPALFITLVALMWPGRKRCLPVAASGVASALLSLVIPLPAAIMLGIFAGMAVAFFTEARND